MARLIEVEERNITEIFKKAKPYSLDVYQRDYRWSDDDEKKGKPVSQLLQDIELRFNNSFQFERRKHTDDLGDILEDVEKNFKPYFLNTIMLNEHEGRVYIVDGQQRLTTILLILIKLYHLGKGHGDAVINVDKWIGERIYEEDMARRKNFKISNPDRNAVIQKVFEKAAFEDNDIKSLTQRNLKTNYYQIISKYYDSFFDSQIQFNTSKYNYYVYYLLQKVLLIEQVIKNKEDVALIFETANDRGKELESHEVLKGMLLGVLDVKAKEDCNKIWNNALQTFYETDKNYGNVDVFFMTYFRAKYADTASQYEQFAGKYHRVLLSNEKVVKALNRNKPALIKEFIEEEFVYFYKLYLKLIKLAKENKHLSLSSNHANNQGMQYLLLLSAMTRNDPEESDKIDLVSKRFDQFFTVSNLIKAGDNNDRQKFYYELNEAIRNKTVDEINQIWERKIVDYLKGFEFTVEAFNDIFDYKHFRFAKVDRRFTKYLLSRVDYFLGEILSEQTYAKQESFHFITHSGSKPVHGFHIEHMFSYNEKIMDQFVDEHGDFDEKLFTDERNRLGAVLLLKGNENLRTGNGLYEEKFDSYNNSGFIWNRILTGGINQASLNNCTHPIKSEFKSYQPDDEGLLNIKAIEERHRLLFKLIKEIYSN